MKLQIALLLVAGGLLQAADPTGAVLWSGGQLDALHKEASTHMDETKSGMNPLVKESKFNAIVFHREGPGPAEIHEKLADFLIVREGEGAVLVGGKAVNPKPTTAGEQRGDKVEGGTRYELKAGDVLYIPAAVPHQVLAEKGKFMNALVIKMEGK